MKHALLPNAAHEASVVSLRHRYVLVVNSKTAGTTLKTIAARLEAEPLAGRAWSDGDDPAQRVENWLRTPTLADLDGSRLREVFLDNTFFRFTTVRNPLARCWSAWVDKVVRRHPEFSASFGDRDWFPHELSGPAALLEAFDRFVEALCDRPGLLGADRHWAPQHLVLQWPAFPYDFVGRTEEFSAVVAEWERATGLPIKRHAAATGRRNANSLGLPGNLVSDRTWQRLLQLYSADLAAFGYGPDRAAWEVRAADWEADADRILGNRHGPATPREALWRGLRQGGPRGCRRLAARLGAR